MKSLITGAQGMLGRRLVESFSQSDLIAFGRDELDVTDLTKVRQTVRRIRPDWIVHAAAFTQVDEAERQADEAFRVNALGARNVALAALEQDCGLVYFSTDYVFDGKSATPVRELDTPAPVNVYGASKLAGERLVRSTLGRHLILRTSWLFGADGSNFVDTITEKAKAGENLRVVDDQIGSPCYTNDLSAMTAELVSRQCVGTYHVTNTGHCSWYELARHIVSTLGLLNSVTPVASSEFPRPARRPRFSVLENWMLRLEGIRPLRDWKEAVAAHLEESH